MALVQKHINLYFFVASIHRDVALAVVLFVRREMLLFWLFLATHVM